MDKLISPALRSLNSAQDSLGKIFQKLSSGIRIASASDDPAGLAVADSLAADRVVLGAGSRNIGYGTSAISIADAALGQISNITTRLNELATQSANGTLSDTQRSSLQGEYDALVAEVQRIGSTTEFNGRPLLDGSSLAIQAGTGAGSDSQISVQLSNISSLVTSVASDISTQSSAQSALTSLESFGAAVSATRGQLGSASSRLEVAQQNNDVQADEAAAAESRIRDLDIASAVAEKTQLEILQKTSTAVLAQGNLSRENVLRLLT